MDKNTKIISLDVLRGLACLAVTIHHIFMFNPVFFKSYTTNIPSGNGIIDFLNFSALKFVWDGHAAVILFFVLSGFVLSISFFKNDTLNYKKYLLKRMCRIYLPFAVIIAIGSLGSNYFKHYERLLKFTDWLNKAWNKSITGTNFIDYLLMRDSDFVYLSQSIWSLPVEIKVSIFLPFVIVFFKKIKPKYDLVFVLLNMIVYHVGKRLGLQDILPDFALLYYLTFFMAGISLYKNHQQFVTIISKLTTTVKMALFFVSIMLYTNYSNLVFFLPWLTAFLEKMMPSDYLITLGSVLLMLLILSTSSDNKFLSNKYLVYVGKISFSLYLIHPIVIMIICFTMGAVLPFYVLHPLCFVASLIAAVAFYKFIELPTKKLGFVLTKKLK
ncbi:acyltransferase family protein [Flavobacterium sp. ZS1P70]|uniref:Acyltransferase family protein n=1 Tax=Flavobacterium zhoui TaxID=3230414 RepID=A0ABW6I6V0_9FLAO